MLPTYKPIFRPIIGIVYSVFIQGQHDPLYIIFSNKNVELSEIIDNMDCFECLDNNGTEYIYFCDKYGNHEIRTKKQNGNVVRYVVNKLSYSK